MLTTAQVKEIKTGLTEAGLSFEMEKPDEELDFEISIVPMARGTKLFITPGKVDLKVFPDKKNKQSILWVDEERRTLTEELNGYISADASPDEVKSRIAYLTESWGVGQDFPVRLPEGTTYKIKGALTHNTSRQRIVGQVVATVPASRQTFLVGRDEHSHFVSLLPKRVDNVSTAHQVLRPRNVPEGSPRQGEWFFVPANDRTKAELEEIVKRNPESVVSTWLGTTEGTSRYADYNSYSPQDPEHWGENETSHAALTAVVLGGKHRYRKSKDGKRHVVVTPLVTYVTGYVIDDRRPNGLPSRHDPLWLDDWHKVVRNLEVVMEGEEENWD